MNEQTNRQRIAALKQTREIARCITIDDNATLKEKLLADCIVELADFMTTNERYVLPATTRRSWIGNTICEATAMEPRNNGRPS